MKFVQVCQDFNLALVAINTDISHLSDFRRFRRQVYLLENGCFQVNKNHNLSTEMIHIFSEAQSAKKPPARNHQSKTRLYPNRNIVSMQKECKLEKISLLLFPNDCKLNICYQNILGEIVFALTMEKFKSSYILIHV